MAESDKIKSNQLIEDNVFDNTTKSAIALEAELSKLVIGFEGIIKANAEMLKLNKDPKTSAQLKITSAAIIENEKARKALLVTQKAQEQVQQQLIKNGTEQLRQDRELSKNSQQKQKDLDKEIKLQQQQNSEFSKGEKALLAMKKQLQELKFTGKDNTEEFKKMNAEFMTLQSRVRGTKEAFGDFQHHVGDYQGKFNGLGNSVNQLTREMPAFANSMQTGFMAISNNLPIFFDEITKANNGLKEMQAEGKKTPSLFQTIASSIFTWGTALSIGVTLLTVFGKELVIMIGNLFKADEAFKISAEKQTQYNKEFLDRANERIEAMLKIKLLTGEMSQFEIDNFKDKRSLEKQEQTAIQKHFGILDKIAEHHNVKVEDLNKKGSFMRSDLTFVDIEESKAMNLAVEKEQTRFRDELIDIEKTAIIKRNENSAIEADRIKKENEEKAKKLKSDHDKKMKAMDDEIIQEMEKIREGREKADKIITDFNNKEGAFNPEKTEEIVWYNQDEGITLEDHNAQVDMQAKFRADQLIKDEQDRQKKISETQKLEQQTTIFLKQELDKRNAEKINALNAEIVEDQRKIDRQFQLAKEGKENQLAFEEQQLAKDQLAKKDAQEKDRRQKESIALAEAYMNAYNAELKQPNANPTSAAAKALGDVLLAKGIANGLSALMSNYDGTEDTGPGGGIDNKGGFLAIQHPHERVVNRSDNKKIGDLSNRELTDIAVKYNTGALVDISKNYNLESKGAFAENIASSMLLQGLEKHSELLQIIADKPIPNFEFAALHGRLDMIETWIYNGRKDIITHKGKTRI